jgi:hypothetical protein
LLLAKLRQAQPLRDSSRDTAEYGYIQALFDALIQIPGPIPSEVILPFEVSWRPEILILLSRNPGFRGTEDILLAMREHATPDAEWAAVNDLLWGLTSTTFFQKTLEEIRITHDFVLTDQDVAFCGGSVGCGLSTPAFPRAFRPSPYTSYGRP